MRKYLILKLDGKYFGYDSNPQYPEALFSTPKKAHVFHSKEDIKELLSWHPHKKSQIIDLLELAHKEHYKNNTGIKKHYGEVVSRPVISPPELKHKDHRRRENRRYLQKNKF
ncbi:hypothetical protein [Shouchella clausii]|uniref:hypothetical protein n=1 Tax=Shouchella clausii TaxID=79880 RepID=UPI001C738AC9|nr:hypothetical protein [Shouchella clausii]MBX0320137.1 hypothetical protein [Shouchella clausii]